MLVYRVENERGIGPYLSFDPALEEMRLEHAMSGDDPRPTPDWDGIDDMDADESSGFQTAQRAENWFGGYGAVLDEAGYELTVWEAQDVREGRTQVVFRKDTAKQVASYPIMEYIR